MQPAHSPLNFRSIDAFDIVAFFVLDKHASEESNHVGTVKKNVRFLKRHALMQCTGEMIDPNPVLPTHVFFLSVLLLLAAKKQTLCGIVSV